MTSLSPITPSSEGGSPITFTHLANSPMDNTIRRKPTRRANTAERRATHNAVERQRRETLNGRFLDLAALLPNLASVRRPSKSAIVNSSIALIHSQRRFRLSASRELRQLKQETDALRHELNEWRERSGSQKVDEPPRSVEFNAILTAADEEESAAVMGMGVGMGWEMELGEGLGEEDEDEYYGGAGSPGQQDIVSPTSSLPGPGNGIPVGTPSHVHPHLAAAHAAHAANLARLHQRPPVNVGHPSRTGSISIAQPQPPMQFDPNTLFPLQIPGMGVDPNNWNAQIYNAFAQQQSPHGWGQHPQFVSTPSPNGLPGNYGFQQPPPGTMNPPNDLPNGAKQEDDAVSIGSSSSSSRSAGSSGSRRGSASGSASSPATSTSTLASAMFMPSSAAAQTPGSASQNDPFGFSRLNTNGWSDNKMGVVGGGGGATSVATLGMFM